MRVQCIAFTQAGLELARRIARSLREEGDAVSLYAPRRLALEDDITAIESVDAWVRRAFAESDALVFVGACGIAVRSIAPYVRDKFEDPAIVSVDEGAGFAIPLLAGHIGGANELARRIADICGTLPAITTATDVRGVFAVDTWAQRQGLVLLDRAVAKRISAILLEGGTVGFSSDVAFKGRLPDGVVALDRLDAPGVGISVSHDPARRPFAETLRLVPRTVTVGVGCRRNTSASTIARVLDGCLERARIAPEAVRTMATIDLKVDEQGLLDLARQRNWGLRFHTADELAAVPGSFASSDFVRETVGVDNVCERAACAAGETLLLGRHAEEGVTIALATRTIRLSFGAANATHPRGQGSPARLTCVGLGPGAGQDLTVRARAALDEAEVIVGYTTYVGLIRDDYPRAEFVATPMRSEVRRCRLALEHAARGRRVALVCSGDPGVYGMAGLVMELAEDFPEVEVDVVPGVTAANGGAALLGAPLMHDWCTISLSDLMTPWALIEERLRAAAQAGFCICLYNPASRGRAEHLRRACDILLEHLPPETVCGIARNVGRMGEESHVLTLAELRDAQVDMTCCVYVGNAQTRVVAGRMVTPRGYLGGGA